MEKTCAIIVRQLLCTTDLRINLHRPQQILHTYARSHVAFFVLPPCRGREVGATQTDDSCCHSNIRSTPIRQRFLAVSLEQTIERFLLSHSELSALDTRVVDTKERVDVVHGLCADVGKFLDLGSSILDLWLVSQPSRCISG